MWIVKESGPPVRDSKDIALTFKELTKQCREEFWVVTYTQKHGELGRYQISIGTLTQSLVHPRECLKPAILDSAAAICCVHNHPSGDPAPSPEDKAITVKLQAACETMGIRFLDHIIVATGGHYSFTDA